VRSFLLLVNFRTRWVCETGQERWRHALFSISSEHLMDTMEIPCLRIKTSAYCPPLLIFLLKFSLCHFESAIYPISIVGFALSSVFGLRSSLKLVLQCTFTFITLYPSLLSVCGLASIQDMPPSSQVTETPVSQGSPSQAKASAVDPCKYNIVVLALHYIYNNGF
jgi:hypothetical protein